MHRGREGHRAAAGSCCRREVSGQPSLASAGGARLAPVRCGVPRLDTPPVSHAVFEAATSEETRRVSPAHLAWFALVVLTLMNLLNYLDRYVSAPIGESLRESSLHVNDKQFGALASAFLIVYMIAAPFFGERADRRSRPRLIAMGVGFWSVMTALAGLATNYPSLLGARAAVGIGEAAYATIAPALLADLFPERLRGRVFAVFFMATPVGAALGYVLGGVVDHHFGWRAAFFIAGIPGLILAALALRLPIPSAGRWTPRHPTLRPRRRPRALRSTAPWRASGCSGSPFSASRHIRSRWAESPCSCPSFSSACGACRANRQPSSWARCWR